MIDQLRDFINSSLEQSWRLPQIDSFLQTFFLEQLPSSTKLQSAFRIDTHASIISIFLKNRSTQLERVQHLIQNINRIFLLNESVQRIVLKSRQYRSLIDQLLEDGKCLTPDKLSNNTTKFAMVLQPESIKLPGFDIPVLNSSFRYLTGKQQEYITKIILNDFLQVNSSVEKSMTKICFLG